MIKEPLFLFPLLLILSVSHTETSDSELPYPGMYPDAANCFKELPRDSSTTQRKKLHWPTCVLVNRRIISRELNEKQNTQAGYNYTIVSCVIHQQVAGELIGIPFDEIISNRNQPEFKRVEEILGKCAEFSFIVPVIDLLYENQVEEYEDKFSKLVGCIEDALKC